LKLLFDSRDKIVRPPVRRSTVSFLDETEKC
jgi:hypothetical protein